MTPSVDLKALRQTRFSEALVRFAFGGAMTAATGFIPADIALSVPVMQKSARPPASNRTSSEV